MEKNVYLYDLLGVYDQKVDTTKSQSVYENKMNHNIYYISRFRESGMWEDSDEFTDHEIKDSINSYLRSL